MTRKNGCGLSGLPSEHEAKVDTLLRQAKLLSAIKSCSSMIKASQKMAAAAQEASWAWGDKAVVTKGLRREAEKLAHQAERMCQRGWS